jgi:hypothetical protein
LKVFLNCWDMRQKRTKLIEQLSRAMMSIISPNYIYVQISKPTLSK